MEYMISFIFALCFSSHVFCGELTFELPDSEKMCFYEHIDKGTSTTLEFQVVMGGNYDIDAEVTSPGGQVLYKDVKKQYDSFVWTADVKGVYSFCFSNEFSTFTHKLVYFDLQVGDEEPIADVARGHATALTMMESSAVTVFEELNKIIDMQTHFKLRETQGRVFAEDLNERVLYWSVGQSVVIILIGIGQILVLRSFFTTRHKTATLT